MISAILTLGVQLKALSLICGINSFTSKVQKTCIVIFQDLSKYYSNFFFHLNANLLISASPVLLKYRHLARFCVFSLTRKLNANCLKGY